MSWSIFSKDNCCRFFFFFTIHSYQLIILKINDIRNYYRALIVCKRRISAKLVANWNVMIWLLRSLIVQQLPCSIMLLPLPSLGVHFDWQLNYLCEHNNIDAIKTKKDKKRHKQSEKKKNESKAFPCIIDLIDLKHVPFLLSHPKSKMLSKIVLCSQGRIMLELY